MANAMYSFTMLIVQVPIAPAVPIKGVSPNLSAMFIFENITNRQLKGK